MDLREASIKIKARGRFIVIRTGASHDRPCTMRRPRAPEFIGPLTLISGLARTAIAGDGRSTSLSLSLVRSPNRTRGHHCGRWSNPISTVFFIPFLSVPAGLLALDDGHRVVVGSVVLAQISCCS